MSLKSFIASMTLCVFATSFCLAEGVPTAPGKSTTADIIPVSEEIIPLVLDSAPAEPTKSLSMIDVLVKPTAESAEVVFTTNIPTYAMIEYGLTTEYTASLTTETMTAHIETISGLTACKTYFYRVLATDRDNVTLDTAHEGTFTTQGCVAKKSTPVVKKSTPAPAPDEIQNTPRVGVTSESKAKDKVQNESAADEIILNAAPDEIQKLETIQVSNDKIQNGNEGVADDTIQALPESPDMPELISEPIEKPESRATETALALLGLLLLVVALIVVRRKK